MLKSFRIQVVLRVVLLSATLYALIYFLEKSESFLLTTSLAVGALVLAQVYLLFRYVEATNRELARFFQSVRHEDFSQTFSASFKDTAFKELNESFTDVMNSFRKTRSETEQHLQYVDTVVQHVGIGLISFEQAGEVELINNAAKRLLKLPQLKNVRALERLSKPLAESVLGLKSGESALVKLDREGTPMQLALHATQFKMKDRLYTLISLQNIQGELERERMSKELEIAQELQRRLLPRSDFQLEGYDLAGICIPAEEVGGDYYDFLKLKDNKLGIVIGDVSGKGVPAAIYMTLTKGIIQACADQSASPKDVLGKVNELMYGTIERGSFMTMAYAVVDLDDMSTSVARAGHNPAIYYNHAAKTASHIESHGIALGMQNAATFGNLTAEKTVRLQPEDLIVFYTDGVTEAMGKNREEFGTDRLFDVIRGNHSQSAHDIVGVVCDEIRSFVGPRSQHDDMTLVVLKA